MLVLSRKIGEVIVINDTIKVVLVDIKGDRVKIGIECDKSIPINRLEVHEKIKEAE